MFVSNSDNLGATLDMKLLTYFAQSNKPFIMECCERTEADKKGGHLAMRTADGQVRAARTRDDGRAQPADPSDRWQAVLDDRSVLSRAPCSKRAPRGAPRAPARSSRLGRGSDSESASSGGPALLPRNAFRPNARRDATPLASRSVAPRLAVTSASASASLFLTRSTRTPVTTPPRPVAPLPPSAPAQLILRESAQCADEDEAAFQDTSKHRFFNTNNLWVRLDLLKEQITKGGGLIPLPMIKNGKTVDPKDDASTKV